MEMAASLTVAMESLALLWTASAYATHLASVVSVPWYMSPIFTFVQSLKESSWNGFGWADVVEWVSGGVV